MLAKRLGAWLVLPLWAVGVLSAAGSEAPLVEAAKNGDRAAVKALLRKPVDVNAPSADGTTALHWAAQHDDLETADLLIRAGAMYAP